MDLPPFKSCCGFLSLRTGCLTIASLAFVLLLCANIAAGDKMSTSVAVANIFAFSYIGLLLYGTAKESRPHLRWWMIITSVVSAILLGVLALCAIGAIATFGVDAGSKDGAPLGKHLTITFFMYAAFFVGVILSLLALSAYIVYSYICELRNLAILRSQSDFPPPEMRNLHPV